MRNTLASRRDPSGLGGLLVGLVLISGCGGELQVSVEPAEVHFGELDFKDWPTDMPVEGYGSTAVLVTNDSENSLDLTLVDADFDRLCVLGITENMVPYSWPELAPGKSVLVQIRVCAYMAEEGDRDTLIEGEISLRSYGPEGDVGIPWSFTPVIDQGSDTGR